MSSCLSGAGRTYTLDLEIIKSPSTSTRTSQTSSSPSSTLSESSNSPLAISTRKPRTPRKRPNQTYNEAAALLSTAYPNIFSSKNLTKPRKYSTTKPQHSSFFDESSELLLPFRVIDDDSGFLLQNLPIRGKPIEPKVESCDKLWQSSSGEVNSHGSMEMELGGSELQEDFDAESILDEEIEEGIDSIMGNLSMIHNAEEASNGTCQGVQTQTSQIGSWYGYPMAMGLGFGGKFEFGLGFGSRRGIKAMRHVDEGNWWNFPTVDVLQISPKTNTKLASGTPRASNKAEREKKKRKPVAAVMVESKSSEMAKENPCSGLQLKLNYEEVVNAWSDRGSPFSEESELPGTDVYVCFSSMSQSLEC